MTEKALSYSNLRLFKMKVTWSFIVNIHNEIEWFRD